MPSQVLGFGKEFTGYKDRAKVGEILRPIEDPVNYEPNAKTDYSKIGESTKEIDLSSYFEVRASSGGRATQLEPHCGARDVGRMGQRRPLRQLRRRRRRRRPARRRHRCRTRSPRRRRRRRRSRCPRSARPTCLDSRHAASAPPHGHPQPSTHVRRALLTCSVPRRFNHKAPSFSVPKFDAPKLDTSGFKAPAIPKFEAPKLDLPKVDLPKADAPDTPSFEAPSFDMPKLDTSGVSPLLGRSNHGKSRGQRAAADTCGARAAGQRSRRRPSTPRRSRRRLPCSRCRPCPTLLPSRRPTRWSLAPPPAPAPAPYCSRPRRLAH